MFFVLLTVFSDRMHAKIGHAKTLLWYICRVIHEQVHLLVVPIARKWCIRIWTGNRWRRIKRLQPRSLLHLPFWLYRRLVSWENKQALNPPDLVTVLNSLPLVGKERTSKTRNALKYMWINADYCISTLSSRWSLKNAWLWTKILALHRWIPCSRIRECTLTSQGLRSPALSNRSLCRFAVCQSLCCSLCTPSTRVPTSYCRSPFPSTPFLFSRNFQEPAYTCLNPRRFLGQHPPNR